MTDTFVVMLCCCRFTAEPMHTSVSVDPGVCPPVLPSWPLIRDHLYVDVFIVPHTDLKGNDGVYRLLTSDQNCYCLPTGEENKEFPLIDEIFVSTDRNVNVSPNFLLFILIFKNKYFQIHGLQNM